MRKASTLVVAMTTAIALYFTLFWGFEALQVLTSPSYGLDDAFSSQFIFGIGRMVHLGPTGLIKLAAFFGVLKLSAALVFAVHVGDRLRTTVQGEPNLEILEGGLVLVVLIGIAAVVPALWVRNSDLAQQETIQLLLAGLAAALMIIERGGDSASEVEPAADVEGKPVAQQGAAWFTPWR